MSTAVATIDRQPRSVLVDMSMRYGMEPAAFEATLRATVCKGSVSREEFAAFLLVAKEYRLNPLTKEIYAFPAKSGGIQPIVSVDGWCRIINEQPALDGIEFEDMLGVDGALLAVTCRIYRKDRQRPTSVTEYMSECRRSTDVWKTWPARMLRHKALIQAARYAFGFSGIVDADEYERAVEVRTPVQAGVMSRLPGGSNGEGFHAQVVDDALGTEQPLPPDEIDAILDGDTLPPHDAETGEIVDAEVETGEPAEATGEHPEVTTGASGADLPAGLRTGRDLLDEQRATATQFDHLSWAADLNRDLDSMSLEEIERLVGDPTELARFEELKAKHPAIAKQLDSAIGKRRKVLA